MILVVTVGAGSLDLYSHKLAENLDVPVFYSDIGEKSQDYYNVSWLSGKALVALWEDWCFIRRLNKLGDIIHLPHHHLGRYGNFLKVPYIITVHDLIRYFDMRREVPFIHRPNLRYKFYLSLDYKGIKKAKRIVAVSQATKNDLMHYLGIPDDRISVIYEGTDCKLFRPVHRRIHDYPYVLFVGTEQSRKNFVGLLKAFSTLKGEPGFKDLKLVKVGKANGGEVDHRGQTMEGIKALGLVDEVVFTGFVPESDLPAYYSGAKVFVLPSLYEGFGLPALEAMACGCPVVASNTSSLPELIGEAGILVNPCDTDSLAWAMREVLTNSKLRDRMVTKGLEQSKKFSWERAAEQTQKMYDELARN